MRCYAVLRGAVTRCYVYLLRAVTSSNACALRARGVHLLSLMWTTRTCVEDVTRRNFLQIARNGRCISRISLSEALA